MYPHNIPETVFSGRRGGYLWHFSKQLLLANYPFIFQTVFLWPPLFLILRNIFCPLHKRRCKTVSGLSNVHGWVKIRQKTPRRKNQCSVRGDYPTKNEASPLRLIRFKRKFKYLLMLSVTYEDTALGTWCRHCGKRLGRNK